MTKHKRWYIENGEKGLILIGSDGKCMKKLNARQGLGTVIDARVPCDKDLEKNNKITKTEAILVSCKLYVDSQNYARKV